jgi:bacterioferritin-associated ferredoxin
MSAKSAVSFRASLRHGALLAFSAACLVLLGPSFPHSHALAGETQKKDSPLSCATCHAGVVHNYATAPMRHAMEPDGANTDLIAHPDLTTTIGPYTYRVVTKDGHSTYSVSDRSDTMSAPIQWIFGQHTQTWILQKDGQFYETLVSFYPRDNTLAVTPDDANIKPGTLLEAMGRQVSLSEVRSCFDCHASGLVAGERLDPSKTTLGIACGRCHQGAQQHLTDAALDNFKTVPKSLKRLDSQQISAFCGQCHRTFDNVIRDRLHGNGTVRFQPYRLELSKCFIGNDLRISCIACHNPHQPADRVAAHYDARCLACHSKTQTHSAAPAAKTCPVSQSNCTSCHMPKTEIAGNHAQFTGHFIRVVKPGEDYPQ